MKATESKSPTTDVLLELDEFFSFFEKDSFHSTALTELKNRNVVQFKGLTGSMDAVIAASHFRNSPSSHMYILHDKEEAAYFMNDLQQLLPTTDILIFPTSYKKPYQFAEIENANILQRAEVLNQINGKKEDVLIVTYPDALTEKVINQRSLLENTFSAKLGEKVSVDFVSELLIEYDFEKTDFVYEAGQFSVRGGIIDIFSYANELPYRLELFGDEIDNIRTFDPITQLSVETKTFVSIIPNVQTKLLQEVRDSFLNFIPKNTVVWLKDYQLTTDTFSKYFQSATEDFNSILKACGDTQVISHPEDLFVSTEVFEEQLSAFTKVEFGNRFYLKTKLTFDFNSSPQPNFNKDFNLLKDELDQKESKGYKNIIIAESQRQLDRLKTIFEEIDPDLEYREMRLSLRSGFIDEITKVVCYTDHQIFERFHRYHEKKKYSKSKALTLKELRELKVGDYITHIDYGIGRFGGMEKVVNNERPQEAIRLIYRDDDILYLSVHSLHKLSKYSGQETKAPKMSKLGSPEWEQKKTKAKKKIKDIAKDLITLYAKRKTAPGYQFGTDNYMQAELESSFLYEETPDQAKAIEDVKVDMEQPHPMDRLVCGDVGFGKTEVAVRAAFKAICDSKQVAVLVPTTILAVQHYNTFKNRLDKFPCRIEFINRFKTAKEIRKTLKEAAEGKIDILIGTHRIISKDVKFKNLGLMIIDEEQKFGVKAKERLKELCINVDSLTLTATPIPRTLQFSLMGARDLSIISTPPPNRQPVTTELQTYSDEIIRDAIRRELYRGGQVFFVHNRIKDIEAVANSILSLVPDARVAYAHGQMDGVRLEKIMMAFIDGDYDVLVSTNIIESGLDIPNANTIIINRAHTFGLSDLHQMRGRVGRSNKKAYCYLITPALIGLSADSRKRLSTLEEFSDLGDGFKVAMRDLDIRGAGNLLGGEQSGFITDLGFDTYNKILEEAIGELKEKEFRDLFKKELELTEGQLKVDCTVETDFEILIPEDYVTNISERLNLYIAADAVSNPKGLEKFSTSLIDRFGPLPNQVEDLLETIRLRWKCEKLGIEKLILKSGTLKSYLAEHENASYYQSNLFGKILKYVGKNPRTCRLKEAKKRVIFIVEDISSIHEAMHCINEILEE
ncbi:transcription-repair coupling factor [Flammeovirgaceae bacterium SG7u.111]|nr:transcription-repair coupling factor [Flammeovirgaceae bacterium SG7u.132]WPO34663.1 transcription-repair coupling factor [Flammeovirgaceae bacterium SG7u.111]